ncbi:hypothetical protein D3C72_1574690 [compost metagenome]
MLAQRRRHAQDQRVAFACAAEVGGGFEAGFTGPRNAALGDVLYIALPRIELVDLQRIDIDAEHAEADSTVAKHQWQADVAEADDADDGFPVLDATDEIFGDCVRHDGPCPFFLHG